MDVCRWRAGALAIGAALALAACSASPERCKVQCGPSGDCPEGTACAADLFCHASDDTAGLCTAAGDADAAVSDRPDAATAPPDAGGLALDEPCGDEPDNCKETCTGPDDCTGTRSRCSRTDVETGAMICTSNCDPIGSGSGGCAAGEKCLLGRAVDGFLDVNCAAHGGVAFHGLCTISADCAPGLICVGTAPNKICERLCEVGGAACGEGSSCTTVAGDNTLGGVEYSYCQPAI